MKSEYLSAVVNLRDVAGWCELEGHRTQGYHLESEGLRLFNEEQLRVKGTQVRLWVPSEDVARLIWGEEITMGDHCGMCQQTHTWGTPCEGVAR